MSTLKRAELRDKLNATTRTALLNAAHSAKLRGNPYVELVHWIEQLALTENSDIQRIARRFGVDHARLTGDLTHAIDQLPRGSSSLTDMSDHIFDAIERGWVRGAKGREDIALRSGHVMLGSLKTARLESMLLNMSAEFGKIRVEDLEEAFDAIVEGSDEGPGRVEAPAVGAGTQAPSEGGSALETYATDLTAQAREGKIDPVVGRDAEIRQIVNILMRRRQNNPILTGEAGVGKTAVVEGFALRIARGDVPPALEHVSLHMLDIGLLQAGASMKGQFEERLRQVIDEVQSSEKPVILFIDEAHTLIGAGGSAGTGDAANLLKPALARGELRTIAATTWGEYKKHIEKDPALTRRFQVVKVEEPTEDKALLMMRGIASMLESHHRVQILDEALEGAVQLSHRYVPARQLPDKAVSLLDTACARVAVSQHAVPAEVEDRRRRIEALEVEAGIIAREQAIGLDTGDRAETVAQQMESEKAELADVESRWESEQNLVSEVLDLRAKLRSGLSHVTPTGSELEGAAEEAAAAPDTVEPPPDEEAAAPLSEAERGEIESRLKQLLAELETLQGESPLILPSVDRQAVASVVQDWTGIPVGRMVGDEIQTVLELPATLGRRVVGQNHAMETVAKRIQTSRAGLTAPEKPIGVFLLVGPSGVGKTETALTLAEALYGGEQNLITINMSEFQEAHTVSTLKGAPPGYVGYGEGGVLTEAVRRRPYSAVLLDEVEKAHADVHEIFYQVFDKGMMEDGEGRPIDFKNTLILLTSNVGSEMIMKMCEDPELAPDADAMSKALRPELLKVFPAALLGRVVVVPYFPLDAEGLNLITGLKLKAIQRRIAAMHGAELTCSDAVYDLIRERCTEIESGGRMIDAILTNTMLPAVSREVLGRMAEGQRLSKIAVDVADGEFVYQVS